MPVVSTTALAYPDTCECVLRLTCSADSSSPTAWTDPVVEATEIVETCDAHIEITDVVELYDTIRAEMAPIRALRSAKEQVERFTSVSPYVQVFFTYFRILDWYIEPATRATFAVVKIDFDYSDLVGAFEDYVASIENLTVAYVG